MIAVIDYGAGNLGSVDKALRYIGAAPLVTHDPADLDRADALVLPGVGALSHCMAGMQSVGMARAVPRFIESKRPFLGICIGMQMLFGESEEGGRTEGLSLLQGTVRRFGTEAEAQRPLLKVPHMGWNSLRVKRSCPLFAGLPDDPMVYFVHSYYAVPQRLEAVVAETEYGGWFCSAVQADNVYATQFHPEKSGSIGLEMLRNFVSQAT